MTLERSRCAVPAVLARCALAALFLCAVPASAATLFNGSLEFTGSNGPFIDSVPGGSRRYGWTATVPNRDTEFLDSRGPYGPAGDQFGFVDLNGIQNAGGIGQNVAGLVNGQQYRVDFLMSGNAGPSGNASGDGSKSLAVLFAGASLGSFTYTISPAIHGSTGNGFRIRPRSPTAAPDRCWSSAA
jgi:hypothetical protein